MRRNWYFSIKILAYIKCYSVIKVQTHRWPVTDALDRDREHGSLFNLFNFRDKSTRHTPPGRDHNPTQERCYFIFMFVFDVWPTYYSIGKGQLIIRHDQARLKSAQRFSPSWGALSPLQHFLFSKRQVDPAHRRVNRPCGFAFSRYFRELFLTTHFSIIYVT